MQATRDEEALAALRAVLGGRSAHELESAMLDFKEHRGSVDDLLRIVIPATLCFANGNGGVVVVGVDNKRGGVAAFKGTTADADLVQRRIFELSRPPLVVDVWEQTAFPARLLLISVPRSPEIHSDTQGRAPRRVGTSCLPMDPTEQALLREERRLVDWSASPSGRSIRDASAAAIAAARRRVSQLTHERRKLANLSDVDLLRALGVIADGVLTRAGEVLFCEPTDPIASSIVYQYKPTPGGEPRLVERLATPLLLAFERTMDLIRARLNVTPVTLTDGTQIQLADFPELAIREALTNAILHRDYHLADPVQIEHSPEILVINSPGPLVSGVTPDNILTHTSKPRNRMLFKAARDLGIAEEVGRGVDRIYREMIRSGRDIPQISSEPRRVRVALVGGAPNLQIARFVAQLPAPEPDDTDTMLVIFRLCGKPTVEAAELAPLLQKTVDETEMVLRRLRGDEVGLLEPTRQTARMAHPRYRLRGDVIKALGTAVPYTRRTADEIDKKLVAHMREYGKVTNRTVQNLLDVGIPRANAVLRDLVKRGILIKTSDHERGPGVEYGRGPKFPARGRPARR